MRLAAVAAAATALLALAAPRPAAACSKRHQPLFELADLARDVAIVKVTAVPAKMRAGSVSLRVTRALKGRRAALTARETNTSCHTGFRRGRTALVFLGADRWPVGSYEGYVERPAPIVVSTIAAWIAAPDAAARVDVLVGAIAGTDRTLRADAAQMLADEPALIAALTPAATATLVAVMSSRIDAATSATLLAALLRAHGDVWRQFVAGKPTSTPAHRGHAALLAHDLEAIDDPAALADRILAATGEHAPERIAAAERCERVRGVRLARFTSYANGSSDHGWKLIAEACRTGTPLPF